MLAFGIDTSPSKGLPRSPRVRAGETCSRRDLAGLTAHTLSCAARARVTKPTRHAACLHVRRAMQAA
jgi:hypothetical protein